MPSVSWRTDLQRAYSTGPAVEVHLVPVDADARLEVRRVSTLKDDVVRLGREAGLFPQNEAVDSEYSALGATASVRNPRGAAAGLAVLRTGQRSAWESLPKGTMAAIFDPDHIALRLRALIEILLSVPAHLPLRFAPVVGLNPVMPVTMGEAGIPQGDSVTLSMRREPVRTDCEDSIDADDLRQAVEEVAHELAARLDAAFRARPW